MSIHDYIIDHRGFNWASLLAEWTWLIPKKFTVWIMNRFGDLFLVLEDGSVHMLDIGVGSLEPVASSRDDFGAKVDEDDNANDFFMIPLVDQLVVAGMILNDGECYSYKQPPVLGGDYTVENTRILSMTEHFSAFGLIHNQIKDLPDGTRVELKVMDEGL